MVFFVSPRTEENLALQDVHETIGRLPEADRYSGSDRYMFIAELMSKMTGEIAYVESYIKNLVETRRNYKISDGYGDTSFMLGGTDRYSLRLVRWTPRKMIMLPNINNVGLAYDYPHNHDFNLITKGIFGDGYLTDVHRCDARNIIGMVGEDTPLTYQGRFQLSPGSVMWYDRYFDVHEQYPPETFSLSFNVIPIERDITIAQYVFDTKQNKISSFTQNRHSQILKLLSLLCDFSCDEESMDILVATASTVDNDWFKRAVAALIAKHWGKELGEAMDLLQVSFNADSLSTVSAESFSVHHVAS